jgi:hypothetical protein
MRKDKYFYKQNKETPTFQKDKDDKNKGKLDQRKKGFKLPFIMNNSQTH